MPKIEDYHSRPVSITPTGRGMQEWETTARRAGPLYNAAAQDVRERGKLAGDAIEDEGWQLNFLKAYHQLRQDNEEAAQARLDALKPPEYRLQYGKGHGSSSYPGGSSGTSMGGGAYAAGGAIAGAVGLSQVAAGAGSAAGGSKGGKLYDANTGEYTQSSGGGIYSPYPFKDELQRDVAKDPASYDDLTKKLTGESNTEYEDRRAREIDYQRDLAKDPANFNDLQKQLSPEPKPGPGFLDRLPNPLDWIPSGWWGKSGDSAEVTEGREDIR